MEKMVKFNLYVAEEIVQAFADKAWGTDHLSPSQVTEELYRDYLKKQDGLGEKRRKMVKPRRPGARRQVGYNGSAVSNNNAEGVSVKKIPPQSSHKIYYSVNDKKRK